ncbi:MAG: hypothetical protein J6M18_06485 [Actinomycetaceae bacterium]|nr:hypothetical protein [Actinomycetaceae bacterium]
MHNENKEKEQDTETLGEKIKSWGWILGFFMLIPLPVAFMDGSLEAMIHGSKEGIKEFLFTYVFAFITFILYIFFSTWKDSYEERKQKRKQR